VEGDRVRQVCSRPLKISRPKRIWSTHLSNSILLHAWGRLRTQWGINDTMVIVKILPVDGRVRLSLRRPCHPTSMNVVGPCMHFFDDLGIITNVDGSLKRGLDGPLAYATWVFGSSTRDPRNARSPAKIRMFLGFHIPNVQRTVFYSLFWDYLLSLNDQLSSQKTEKGRTNSLGNSDRCPARPKSIRLRKWFLYEL
jgi:hypothetical protein